MKQARKYIQSMTAAVLSAFIMAVANNCLLEEAQLLPGGLMGFSKLLARIGSLIGLSVPNTVIFLILNTAIAGFCFKAISRKFVLFSVTQYLCLSLFMHVLPSYEVFDEIFLNVIFGGVLWGIGISVSLRNAGSTGGTDFIALYVSNKTGNEIWQQVFFFNCLQLVVFGAISGWEHAGYSIIFQYISTKMIENFHNRYKRVMLQIFTRSPRIVCQEYTQAFSHGITVVKGIGGYTGEDTAMLTAITSSYELSDTIRLIKSIDPDAIINVTKSEQLFGKFQQPEL